MKVAIYTKKLNGESIITGEHGEWLTPEQAPEKVLLESDKESSYQIEENKKMDHVCTGLPAIKIGSLFFHFGQPKDGITKYRKLAKGTTVVAVQEEHKSTISDPSEIK